MKTYPSRAIERLLKAEGASLVGFANLSEIPSTSRGGFPFGISRFPFGVSFGVALNRRILAGIVEGPTDAYVGECLRVDGVLESLGKVTSEFLEERGCKVRRQSTTNVPGEPYPPDFTTPLPHKTVATRAGLGWVGKCALLVTKEFGSAVRLGSVVTDAALPVGRPTAMSECGSCTACVDLCPAGAISGRRWEVGVPRDSLVDASACQRAARERLIAGLGREVVGRTFCGICIAVCPFTKAWLAHPKGDP